MTAAPFLVRTTPRLRLRRWRPEDLDALAAMDGDPRVMRYIADGSVRTRAETVATIERLERGWEENGFGLFAVERRSDGALAGWTGLSIPWFLPEVLPAVEIGWRFGHEHWGHGYATEAAREVLRYAFDEVGLSRVVSICYPENEASANVMRKLGLELDHQAVVPASGRSVHVWALTRAGFEAAHSG